MRATAMACLVLVCGCTSSSPGDRCVRRASELDVPALMEATASFCGREACRYDSGPDECRYYVPFDVLRVALLAEDPDACSEAARAELQCMSDSTDCRASECSEQEEATRAACATASSPSVAEPFDGAQELCTRNAECSFAGREPSDEVFDAERAECLAGQTARAWLLEQELGGECACDYARFAGCAGRADLACDASAAEEDAACPDESAAFNSCSGGSVCRETGAAGSPDSCMVELSCAGVLYELSCDPDGCTCTVDGEPGPAITASDCTDAAFRQCGAPL